MKRLAVFAVRQIGGWGCLTATIVALTSGAAFAAGGTGARLRVAIPAILNAYSDPTPATAGEMFTRIFGVQLRERERECDSIELISQKRCDAIMSELTSPTRRNQADRLLAEFRKFQPVDAIVYYTLIKDSRVEVRIVSDSGTAKTNFDIAAMRANENVSLTTTFAGAIPKAMGFIADTLPISARDRKVLAEVRISDPLRFAAVYTSQYFPAAEVLSYSPAKPSAPYAGPRVNTLLPIWKMDANDPLLSLAVVKAAAEMYLAYSEPKDGQYLTTPTFLKDSSAQNWVAMAKFSFRDVLGARDEDAVYPLARMAPSVFVKDTIELAAPVLSTDENWLRGGTDADASGIVGETMSETPVKKIPRAKRLGAVRVLGIMNLPETIALLQTALGDEEADVREAAAFGAGWLPAKTGVPLLQPLLKDKNSRVAFAAAASLRKMGAAPAGLTEMAKPFLSDTSNLAGEAVAVLVELGGKAEVSLLQKLSTERTPQQSAVVAALLRLDAVTGRQRLDWLSDCDEAVIQAVLASTPDLAQDGAVRDRLETLANDPFMPIANRARYLLSRTPPKDPWELMAQELKTEHPYVREEILDKLAADTSAPATKLLQAACDNPDHHVRVKAMQVLAQRDPASARPYVAKELTDPYQWVRFHAAVLAPLVATPDMAPALKAALDQDEHSATRSYLRDALAKAEGGPAPKQPDPARPIKTKRNLAWDTAPGIYTADSPFDAYYCMDTRWIKQMRAAHNAGKILYARCMPLRAPAKLVLDRAERDAFIPRLDMELSDEVMEMLDGVIYGEETMDFLTDALWDDGWQLFCRDAKLDPVKIDGKIDNLNVFERRAWNDWTWKINIKGFNMLADFTRLRYGKLRPGLQVGSFDAGGSPEAHCDFGGVYDYKGDNRLCAYDLVRAVKTVCPERPVLWLSLGLGGYEMNPVSNTDKVPAGPLFDTYDRSWSDSLTAWLAGADNGWFSVWLFISPLKGRTDSGPESLRGRIVWLEDIRHDSPILLDAIDWTQIHASKYKEPVVMPNLAAAPGPVSFEMTGDQKDVTLEDPDDKQAAGQKAVDAALAKQKEEMTVGFLYNQQYVYDCARVFASLPRQEYRSQALVNREGVDVWTRPECGYPLIPAQALLNRYDYMCSINQAPSVDLSKYRLFITHDPQLLQDASIRAVRKWLTETPGLLVVHRGIPAENDAEASTVDDHDGKLQEDWPWEKDIRIATNAVALTGAAHPIDVAFERGTVRLTNGYVRTHFALTGPKAKSLASVDGQTVLALWQDPGVFKGMVLFDGMEYTSNEYLDALRATINALYTDKQVGMRVEGPALLETLNTPTIAAAAATHYYNWAKEAVVVPGMSALGLGGDPAVGRLIGSTSGLTIRNYVGRFIAASESLVAVSEKPFSEAKFDGDSLILKSPGVVHVSSASQGMTVATLDGKVLPVVKTVESDKETGDFGKDGFARWLFNSTQDGVYHWRYQGAVICYFRSRETVVVRPAPPLHPASRAKIEPEKEKAAQAARLAQAEKEKARKTAAAEEMTIDLGGGVKMAFVKIKAVGGWVGKFEVTNQEFKRFRPEHGSLDYGGSASGDRQPAVYVSYDDAVAFGDWLNETAGAKIPQGLRARLPDGDEWLAYARCGDNRIYPWGNQWPPEYGNYFDSSDDATNLVGNYRDGYDGSCPVENSGRNDWGLYGVGGNVWEWTDELTPKEGEWRIRRGAFWGWDIWGQGGYEHDLRCAHRSYAFPNLRHASTGFRLVLAPAK